MTPKIAIEFEPAQLDYIVQLLNQRPLGEAHHTWSTIQGQLQAWQQAQQAQALEHAMAQAKPAP